MGERGVELSKPLALLGEGFGERAKMCVLSSYLGAGACGGGGPKIYVLVLCP